MQTGHWVAAITGLPFLKHKEDRPNDHEETHYIVPFELLPEIYHGKDAKNHQSYDLLNGFQLGCRELGISYAVSRDLEAIFHKGDKPASYNRLP